MIITEKMQESMHEKMRQMRIEGLLEFHGLAFERLAGDDDVAEHRPGHRTRRHRKGRKGQHIRRLVLVAPFGVDRPHGRVVGEDEGKFRRRFRQWLLLFGREISCCRFENGRGLFFGDDLEDGVPVRVRFDWTAGDSPVWEQSFSADGEKTWEKNWIMRFDRA